MSEEERLVDQALRPEDIELDISLRPATLGEFVGQEKLKENLNVFVNAAKARGEALDHVLFYGPPGLGKTTMAYIIAEELGSQIRITSGPAVERSGDLASILTNLEEGDVLFCWGCCFCWVNLGV